MIIFSSSDVSESEKIEQIHAILLSQHRARVAGIVIKLAIIAAIGFGYHYYTQPENLEKKIAHMAEARKKFSEFVSPLVSEVMGDVLMKLQDPKSPNAAAPNITPEMIKAVRDSMQK